MEWSTCPLRERRLSILDGMILVATTAVALTCLKAFGALARLLPPSTWVRSLQMTVWVALPLTLALIPLRLREPRPPRPQLWRQPGWLAEIAVAVSAVHCLLQVILQAHLGGALAFRPAEVLLGQTTFQLPSKSSCSVAAIWVALATSGRWGAEKSWIDRTGRLLGWYRLVYPVVNWSLALL